MTEFVHYHPGTKADPAGIPMRKKAEKDQHPTRIAGNHLTRDPRAPDGNYNASVKVRDPEAVHMPEYKGWHSSGNAPDNEAWKWKYTPPPGIPTPTHVSRGPKLRVSENAGFSWDPSAAYGPETIKALPAVDDSKKEDMFDETADQAFDGEPGSGIAHFGVHGMGRDEGAGKGTEGTKLNKS